MLLSFETPLATCPVRHATLSRCLSLVPPCLGHIMLNDTVFFDIRAVSALAKGGGLRTFRDGADLSPHVTIRDSSMSGNIASVGMDMLVEGGVTTSVNTSIARFGKPLPCTCASTATL